MQLVPCPLLTMQPGHPHTDYAVSSLSSTDYAASSLSFDSILMCLVLSCIISPTTGPQLIHVWWGKHAGTHHSQIYMQF